jgi:TrmH family RNA methyltransferase
VAAADRRPPTTEPITSRDNPLVKRVRALQTARGRSEQGAYLIEGVTLLLDALARGQRPQLVLRDESRLSPAHRAALDEALAHHQAAVRLVGPSAFRAMATTETPQGVAAVLPLPPLGALEAPRPGDLCLIADGLQDPGNLGAVLRAAAGAGVGLVLTTPGTVDPFAPKVMRAGMGAHFRLRLAPAVTWSTIEAVIGTVLPLLGAEAGAARAYDAVDWRAGGALVIGNEAAGLSAAARAALDDTIAIPLLGGVESLNAAQAAAVILFEAARQRRPSRA